MPGLSMRTSGRASAAIALGAPGTMGGSSGSNTGTVTQAAFGPGATTGPGESISSLSPGTGHGLAFWGGVLAIGVLLFIRSTLPR